MKTEKSVLSRKPFTYNMQRTEQSNNNKKKKKKRKYKKTGWYILIVSQGYFSFCSKVIAQPKVCFKKNCLVDFYLVYFIIYQLKSTNKVYLFCHRQLNIMQNG